MAVLVVAAIKRAAHRPSLRLRVSHCVLRLPKLPNMEFVARVEAFWVKPALCTNSTTIGEDVLGEPIGVLGARLTVGCLDLLQPLEGLLVNASWGGRCLLVHAITRSERLKVSLILHFW